MACRKTFFQDKGLPSPKSGHSIEAIRKSSKSKTWRQNKKNLQSTNISGTPLSAALSKIFQQKSPMIALSSATRKRKKKNFVSLLCRGLPRVFFGLARSKGDLNLTKTVVIFPDSFAEIFHHRRQK